MDTENKIEIQTDPAFKKYTPILTTIFCVISIILFVGINLETDPGAWEAYKKWGSPSPTDIFNGAYWGLITSNFLHTELWHIAFNLYWLWFLGKKVEYESSKVFYLRFILSAALVSSAAQLSFSDNTGIGLSGIAYALFGYIFIQGRTTEAYKNYLDKRTVSLFIFWLFLCIVLTKTKVWSVGNAAHIGGLLWGMLLAYLTRYTASTQSMVSLILLACVCSMITWSPFSISYLSHKAYQLHKDQKVDEAIVLYKKILERDAGNAFATANLEQLEIYKLNEKGAQLMREQKYKEAQDIYAEIMHRDKSGTPALDSAKLLEKE